MSTTVPFKTQLGQDELRSRALKLGQRHRTLLFLIDGRRPLAEVLSLAQQAGAATHHFEDLLRLGLVELPPVPTAASTAPASERADEAALTSVELVVPADADAVQTLPAPLVTEVIDDDLASGDEALPSALMPLVEEAVAAPSRGVAAVLEEAVLTPVDEPAPDSEAPAYEAALYAPSPEAALHEVASHHAPSHEARPAAAAPRREAAAPARRTEPEAEPAPVAPWRADAALAQPVPTAAPLVTDTPRRTRADDIGAVDSPAAPRGPSHFGLRDEIPTLLAVTRPAPRRPTPPRPAIPVLDAVPDVPPAPEGPAIDIDLPLPDRHEARLLQEVRQLLNDTLRIDAPLFSARTFVRVRNAQSINELINLVWEIQDHMSAKRRSRRELQSLQRARELLGLGNTLVSEDSHVDYRD